MNILIDINHPAHVHLFKIFAKEMIKKRHKVFFICREKEFEKELLTQNKFDFMSLGESKHSKFNKIWGIIKYGYKKYKIAKKFKPDILLSHGSYHLAHVAFMIRKPHIAFEDTFNFEQIWLYRPFTDVILTSNYDHPFISKKEINYAGFHELAYLSSNRFQPDTSILKELNVTENEKYVIFRFVAWNASHDIGHSGISYSNKLNAVKEFSKYAKVFISSEKELSEEFKKFKLNIAPHRIHDAIAYASLVFGESATMSEEAAMLGVPSVFILTNSCYYTKHLENDYQLMFNYSESEKDQQEAINKGIELLNSDNIKEEWMKKRNNMLSDKIDVTAFLVWFIENYPESKKIMKENPDYQMKFKCILP